MVRSRATNLNGSVDRAFSQLRADYAIGQSTRFRPTPPGVHSHGTHADYHWRSERQYWHAVETARWLDRDDRLFGAGINRLVANVVRDGMVPDPQTGSADLDARLADRWKRWSVDSRLCDSAKRSGFHGLEELFFRHILVDGDVLALLRRDGRLQLVENHRLRTPRNTKRNCVMGVLLDKNRAPLEYWITKEDINVHQSLKLVGETAQFPAFDEDGEPVVLHGYLRERVSSTRGVTVAARLIEQAQQGSDLDFATLVKSKTAACVTLLHQFESDYQAGVDGAMGESETEQRDGGYERTIEDLAPGLNVYGRPGERIEGFTPNVPNAEYRWHSAAIIALVAINLDLPPAVLMLDPTQTNFSGWRGAMDQARCRFVAMQNRLIECFHRPVYRWKVRQWLAEDPELATLAEQNGVDPFGHRILRPTWPYIEPTKDAQADMLRDRGLKTSKRRLAAERGLDWNDISTEIVEDNAAIIVKAHNKAVEISREGLEVSWQQLLALPTPDSVSMAIDTAREPSTESPPSNEAA